jgi:uncharacterized protein YecT (DUF1311 family)
MDFWIRRSWAAPMLRRIFALLAVGLLPPHESTAAQNLVLASQLEIHHTEAPCPADRWCLSIRVTDLETTAPLPDALVSGGECGSVVADSSGLARVECAEEGEVQVHVASIGYRSAGGTLLVTPGHSFYGTASLRPVQDDAFIVDLFMFPPCSDRWGDESKRKCLEIKLEEGEVRLAELLESARVAAADSALFDSAQAAWRLYIAAHCQSRGALEPTPSSSRVAELECRLQLTTERVYQLGYWTWRPRR